MQLLQDLKYTSTRWLLQSAHFVSCTTNGNAQEKQTRTKRNQGVMLKNMNTIVVSGRCFLEPDIYQNEAKDTMIAFVVVDNGFNGREKTVNYHRCVAYGSRAERLSKFLKKGTGISVSGRLNKSKYKGKDGIEREQTDILVNDFMFTDRKEKPAVEPPPVFTPENI